MLNKSLTTNLFWVSICLGILIPLVAVVGWALKSEPLITFGLGGSPMQITTAATALLLNFAIISAKLQRITWFKIFIVLSLLISIDAFLANQQSGKSIFDAMFNGIFYVEADAQAGLMSIQSSMIFIRAIVISSFLVLSNSLLKVRLGYLIAAIPAVHLLFLVVVKITAGVTIYTPVYGGTGISLPTVLAAFFIFLSVFLNVVSCHPKIHHLPLAGLVGIFGVSYLLLPPRARILAFTGQNYYEVDSLSDEFISLLRSDMLLLGIGVLALITALIWLVHSELNKSILAQKIADDLDQNRNMLISAAAHDIASPVKIMGQLIEIVQNDVKHGSYDEAQTSLKLLRERVDSIAASVDSLIKFSKMSAQRYTRETCGLKECISEAIENADPFQQASIQADVDDVLVQIEKMPLIRIVQNLVRNAVVHNDQEEPRVNVTARKSLNALLITITDNGPGIPQNLQQEVFKPGVSLSASGTIKGHGLGLSSVANLLTIIGGEIKLKSPARSDKGTQFELRIPLHA